jgi:hypothetical protein
MMRHFALLAFVLVGCGSDDAPATTTDTGSSTDTNDTPTVPAASCVRPGDKGNDKGVGTFCTPLGKECAGFAGAPLCLADVGQDQWMCSRIGCSTNADCGMDATCYKDPKGAGCVPNRCLSPTTDAGGETSADAPAEASTDATSSDAVDGG